MKILIVDDEADQERLLKFAFRRKDSLRDFQLLYAGNGNAAIHILNNDPSIELALLDINMPEMDGLTLLNHLRQHHPSIQCIMLSAYGDMTNIRTAMNRGAFDFLTKPVDVDDLENTISKTMQYASELRKSKLRDEENLILKQKGFELEMQALKAQMNPHFIFNCINSIDSFILADDQANATLYLNKFAKLFRNILDGSRQNEISLSQELQTLRLYIELESLRDNFSFDVQYNISPDLDLTDFSIPSLLLQPLAENAIQHGLRNLSMRKGNLFISISQNDTHLVFTLQDNGVGLQKASELRKKNSEAIGLEIVKSRIKNFNHEEQPSFWISDVLVDKEVSGTIVEFKLIKK